jgi:cytochrome c oxidase subunit 2
MVVLMRARRWIGWTLCAWLWAYGFSLDVIPRPRAQADKVVVNVSAERFSFSPSEIKAKPGVPIEFVLKSDDTDHGFRILDTDIDVRIPKRGQGTTKVTFTPAKAGRYTIECSHVCGAGHSFMRATIVVK